MILKDNSFSIVLAGAWNRAILTPIWLVNNLFDNKPEPQVEFSVNFDAPFRFVVKNIIIAPGIDKVIFWSKDNSDESLKLMEETSVRLCSILTHTPLVAVGINFGFLEKNNKAALFDLFKFNDTDGISSNQWTITRPSIKRSLSKDAYFTNLSISLDDNSDFHFDFNFHYKVSETNEVKTFITDKIIDYKNQAISLLNSLYKLNIEENEQ